MPFEITSPRLSKMVCVQWFMHSALPNLSRFSSCSHQLTRTKNAEHLARFTGSGIQTFRKSSNTTLVLVRLGARSGLLRFGKLYVSSDGRIYNCKACSREKFLSISLESNPSLLSTQSHRSFGICWPKLTLVNSSPWEWSQVWGAPWACTRRHHPSAMFSKSPPGPLCSFWASWALPGISTTLRSAPLDSSLRQELIIALHAHCWEGGWFAACSVSICNTHPQLCYKFKKAAVGGGRRRNARKTDHHPYWQIGTST